MGDGVRIYFCKIGGFYRGQILLESVCAWFGDCQKPLRGGGGGRSAYRAMGAMSRQKVKVLTAKQNAPKKRLLSSGLTMQRGSSFQANQHMKAPKEPCTARNLFLRNRAFSNLQLNPTIGQIAQKRPSNVITSWCSGITLAPGRL